MAGFRREGHILYVLTLFLYTYVATGSSNPSANSQHASTDLATS